jgi:hypothetical protein
LLLTFAQVVHHRREASPVFPGIGILDAMDFLKNFVGYKFTFHGSSSGVQMMGRVQPTLAQTPLKKNRISALAKWRKFQVSKYGRFHLQCNMSSVAGDCAI